VAAHLSQYTADYLEEQKGTLLEDPAVALVVSQLIVESARRPVEEVELGHYHQRNHAGPELAPGENR
jgi:hypothetical protein